MPKSIQGLIDTPLAPSRYRLLVWVLYVLLVMLLAYRVGLVWWQWLMMALLTVGLFWSRLQRLPIVQHIAQPMGGDELWQCLVDNGQGEELWQMYLSDITEVGVCVVLRFEVVSPMPKALTVSVYPDQVPAEAYRRLKVLARFS